MNANFMIVKSPNVKQNAKKKAKTSPEEVKNADVLRRSQRSRTKRGDMRPIYVFDRINDFEGNKVSVAKIVGFEKFNVDLVNFRKKFQETLIKRKANKTKTRKKNTINEKKKKLPKIVDVTPVETTKRKKLTKFETHKKKRITKQTNNIEIKSPVENEFNVDFEQNQVEDNGSQCIIFCSI